MKTYLTIFLLFLLCPASRAQDFVAVTVTQDSWISGLDSTAIYGSDTTLGICPDLNYWTYLKFDLAAVSLNPRVFQGVELRLKRFNGTHPETISVYRITDDSWHELTLTGPSRPVPRDPVPSASLATGTTRAECDAWSSPALNDAVRAEIGGDHVLTLMVRQDIGTVGDLRYYQSRNAVPATAAPRLVFMYSDQHYTGDFDGTGCTNVNDFLFLLDNWHTSFFGSPLGVDDFLSFIDNWNQGPQCSA